MIAMALSFIFFSTLLKLSLKWEIPTSALGCLYMHAIITFLLLFSRLTHTLSISHCEHLHLFFRLYASFCIIFTFLNVFFLTKMQAPPLRTCDPEFPLKMNGKMENGFFVFFPSKWSQEASQKILWPNSTPNPPKKVFFWP